jgi:YtkA-like protein
VHVRVSPPHRRGLKLAGPILLVLALAVSSLLPGCRPPAAGSPDIALEWTIAPDPPAVGAATFTFTLSEKGSARRVRGARVRIEADMSHPGMAPVSAPAREIAPGQYRAPLHLTMAGDWVLLVDAELRDGRKVHRQLDLSGVRER